MEFGNLKIKNINCFVKHTPKRVEWVAKNRNDHIIGIKLSGKSIHDLGHKSFVLSTNCLFFLNQKDDFSVKVLEIGETLSIHFTTYEPINTDSFCIKLEDSKKVIGLIEKAKSQSVSDLSNENLMLSSIYRLCAELEYVRNKQYFPKDARLSAAKEYIDLHFQEKDCLKYAAEGCSISRRRFNELFKYQFDITPSKYITELKIDFSKRLLQTKTYTIFEISEMSGFSDVYYFSKVFKTQTGYSPGEYRMKQLWEN